MTETLLTNFTVIAQIQFFPRAFSHQHSVFVQPFGSSRNAKHRKNNRKKKEKNVTIVHI